MCTVMHKCVSTCLTVSKNSLSVVLYSIEFLQDMNIKVILTGQLFIKYGSTIYTVYACIPVLDTHKGKIILVVGIKYAETTSIPDNLILHSQNTLMIQL